MARVEWVEECRMTQEMIQANLMGLKNRVARDRRQYDPCFNDFIRETRRKAQKEPETHGPSLPVPQGLRAESLLVGRRPPTVLRPQR